MVELIFELLDILFTFFIGFAIVLYPIWKSRDIKTRTVFIIYGGLCLYLCVGFLILKQFIVVDFRALQLYKICATLPINLTPFFVFRKRVWQNVFLLSVLFMYSPIYIGTGTFVGHNWFQSAAHPLLMSNIVSLVIVIITLPPLLILLRQLCDSMDVDQTKVWRIIWLLPMTFFAFFIITHNPLDIESFKGSIFPSFRIMIYFAMLLACYLLKTSLQQASEAQTARNEADELAAKTDFFKKMNHNLRTPLTKISTNIQIAKTMPEDYKELLEKSQAEIMLIADMINDALDDGREGADE